MNLKENHLKQIEIEENIRVLENKLKVLEMEEKELWEKEVWGKMTWGEYLNKVGLKIKYV